MSSFVEIMLIVILGSEIMQILVDSVEKNDFLKVNASLLGCCHLSLQEGGGLTFEQI